MKINQNNVEKIARLIRARVVTTLVEALEHQDGSLVSVQFTPEKVFVAVYADDDTMLASSEVELVNGRPAMIDHVFLKK